MAGFVLSNVAGLVNRVLYSRAFGTGPEIDAFNFANSLPSILFYLMAGGALASAFVPVFTGLLTTGDRDTAWRLASAVGNLVFLGLLLASALAWIAAPWLVRRVIAPFIESPAQITLTVSLLRVLLLSPAIFGVSGLLMGVINAHQRFLQPALAPTFHWLGWILGTSLLAPRMGIHGLAWGVVLGAGLHLAVQIPGLRGLGGRYIPALGLEDRTVRQVGRLMAPRVLGLAVVQLNFLVNRILASGMPVGSLTAIDHAFALMTMPQVVIAQAIAIAALPTFSEQVARGKLDEMRTSLAGTLRAVVFLSLPASLGLIALRRPIVALFLEHGAFDEGSTRLVAWGLLWYGAGLLGHSLLEVVVRAFYAMQDTRTPVWVGAVAMGLNVVFSLAFSALFLRLGWAPHGGLALANSLATALECAALLWLMRNRLGGLDAHRLRGGLLATLGASLAMVAGLSFWLRVTGGQSVWLVGGGGVALGLGVYWLVALGLKAPEARQLPSMLLKHG